MSHAALVSPLALRVALAQPNPKPEDTRTRVFAFPLYQASDVSRITTTRLEEVFRSALGMSEQLKMLGDADLIMPKKAEAAQKPAASAKIEEADNKLWQGKELLEKKKRQEAATVLQAAVDLYRDNYVDLVDYDKLVDAYVQVAEAYFHLGYDDNGREALTRVVSLRPTVTVDRRLQHKKLVDALDKLLAEQEGHKSGELSISSSPAGARVFVDGVLRGNSPVTINNLRKGEHYVQIRMDGYKPHAQVVRAPMGDQRDSVAAILEADVKPAEMAEGEFVSPEPLIAYAESGNFAENFRRAAKSFTERGNVENLVYGFISRAPGGYALHLFLYDRKAAELAALNPVTVDAELTNAQVKMIEAVQNIVVASAAFPVNRIVVDPPPSVYRDAAAAAAAVVLPPTPGPGAGGPPGPADPLGDYPSLDDYPEVDPNTAGIIEIEGPDDEPEWYETWWFWTLVGVGVAGAGVGTAAGLGAFDSSSGGAPAGFTGTITLP
jgi:hypothetical protein